MSAVLFFMKHDVSEILQVGQAAREFHHLCLEAVDLLVPSDFDNGHTQAIVHDAIQNLLQLLFCNKNMAITQFER